MHSYQVVFELDGERCQNVVEGETPAHAAFKVGMNVAMDEETGEEPNVRLLDVTLIQMENSDAHDHSQLP